MKETKQENQETAEEPAQSPPVERVTEKVKDPKKKSQPGVPALPSERQSKKNDFSSRFEQPRNHFVPTPPPPLTPAAPANIPPKETDQAVSRPKRREGLTNWTPWIVWACLTGGAYLFLRQTRRPASVAAGPVDSAPKQPVDKPPRPDRQLKASPDPFYMEKCRRYDNSSNRREDDRERALPQCGRLWLGHGIRPTREDGDGG